MNIQTKIQEAKSPAEVASAVKSGFITLEQGFNELKSRLDETDQRMEARRYGGNSLPPSAGRQLIESEEFKNLSSNIGSGRRVGVEVKATITSATSLADGSAGDLIVPQRDMVYTGPKRRMTVRNLIPSIRVTSGSVEYAKQTGFTNSADTVAEGATKPQSELQYDLVNVPIRTIAHWVIASRQVLDDAPQLMGLIDTELLYGLDYVEEDQLLNGGGTGTDLNGIVTQATAFAAGSLVVATPNKIDVIGAALLQNALADEPATGIVIHPADWTSMRLIKDGDGKYLLGDPGAEIEPRLFGLPVVATQAMTAGNFLVGNFNAATIYDRWDKRVEVSTEDSDNFRKNLVTILAEERLGMAVKNAAAFTDGTFSTAITDLTS